MKRTTLIASVAVTLGLAAAAAAGKPAAEPKPPAELAVIHRLVGKWQGQVKVDFGATKGTATLSIACSEAAGRLAVSCNSTFTGIPGGPVHEQDLFGYDAGQGKYHWFAVTSMGETHDHVAERPSNGQFTWIYSGLSEGQPMQEIIHMKISPDGRRSEFQTTMTVDGKPAGSLGGTITKG